MAIFLANNLKALREREMISQSELADKLAISTGSVGMYELGKREPDIEMLVRLAEYFGVTLDDLVLKDLRPPMPVYVTNLRSLRKKQGLTQENMAGLLGYRGKQGYNAIENGKAKPSVEVLEKLADFFGVTMDQLLKTDLKKEERG